MNKYSKILYLCALLLLGWLAVKPYLPNLEKEWEGIIAVWKNIREERAKGVDENPEPSELNSSSRERAIAAPKPATAPAAPFDEAEALDPFILEARERAQEDPEAAMQWIQEQSTGAERLRGMLEVVALWAAEDSESALLWLESNAQGLARLETLNSGVELWAQRDPKAAADWIDGMANDQSKISAAKSLASNWVQTNPTAATNWVDGLPSGPVREEAASALTLSWMQTDPATAADWAYKEASATGSGALISAAISEYASIDPDAAEAFIRKIMPSDPFQPDYINDLIATRTKNDPYATVEWLEGLDAKDPLNRKSNVTQLMQVWTETDSIAASSWLSEQPIGPKRDAAIAGFAKSIQRFEPEAAATWANTISNPSQRTEQLTNSLRTWSKSQPDAALNWVLNSDIEPALQKQLASEIGFE